MCTIYVDVYSCSVCSLFAVQFLTPVSFVAELLLVSDLDHALQSMLYLSICASFWLVCVPPCAPAPHHTHANPYTNIYIHLCTFMIGFTKHDVRGNFPGHRGSKHALHDHFCLCLSCFCARCVTCTPPHLYVPICTHLNTPLP